MMPAMQSICHGWSRLFSLLSILTACLLTLASTGAPPAAPRPNILLIMADDMGFSDLGCYGGEIRTPHLDRLAAEGLRFTQFYNNAKCTTTRASLLSGMYPRGNGSFIPLGIPTLGEVMRSAGYQTALSGKWHLGSRQPQRPIDRGFDEYYGLMDGCCNFFNPVQPDPPFKGGRVRVFGHNEELISSFPEDYYTTDAFTDHAIRTMRRFAEAEEPFLMHVAYTAPHYPLHAPPEDIARYRGRYRMGWGKLREQRHARQLQMGLLDPQWEMSGPDSESYDWDTANQDWEDHRMAVYAAMVDRMDQNIGRLLDTLRELGLETNTVVMFLSDNGGCAEEPGGRDPTQEPGRVETYTAVGPAWGWAQNAPFRRYKSWMYEGGIATPFIVRWPGHLHAPPGSFVRAVGHIIDILPTCLELAGASYPETFRGRPALPVEGRSLMPIFQGIHSSEESDLFWEWAGNAAMRRGDWKLVWDKLNTAGRWELYDMAKDRTEIHDVAEENAAKVQELRAAYERWAKATRRTIPGPPL